MPRSTLTAVLVALAVGCADAMPRWSWDTIQTYVHCANYSGEWNPQALQVLAAQPFVVFEKYHKIFEPPVADHAEDKIVASCKAVKALSPTTDCYIYTESDWARTEYSLGHWFDANREAALQCPHPGDFVNTSDVVSSGDPHDPSSLHHYSYLAYDFNNSEAREKWVERVTNLTVSGYIDGAFVDGNRNGFNSHITSTCSADKQAGWAAGLAEAMSTLAHRLGPNKTLISNYPTTDALALCTGGMMERGGAVRDIEAFGKKTCGPWEKPCLLDFHAQYFNNPEDGKMASFLLGMNKFSYFGGGSGWGGPGPGACGLWLKQFPEFKRPLGEPTADMTSATASWPGAVCDESTKRGDTSGCLWTRSFGAGPKLTKVFVGQYLKPNPPGRNKGSCIYWSDGTVTTANATECMPASEFDVAGAAHARARATAYSTNFSTIDPAMWTIDTGCFSCSAPKDPKTVFECTNNTASALRPGSINGSGAGLSVITTRLAAAGDGCHPAGAGGTSGHISSVQPFTFGTIRVKAKYFPGTAAQVASAKGFVGLEDPGSGAITITMHGKGGAASGSPPGTDWTRTMQSSCYQHGGNHDKVFSPLGVGVNAAAEFNVYEIDWRPDAVTLSVNGAVVRRVTDPADVPQKPLHVRLHARSTDYHTMAEGSSFESFVEEFSFEPAA